MDKDPIRERIWDDLADTGVARFPFPPHGRIPNVAGAREAAERLSRTEIWNEATTLKVNPDAPQHPVRTMALEAGKRIFVPVPRLRDAACFNELDPSEISNAAEATTIDGMAEFGTSHRPKDLPEIDLVVVGSVAVDEDGGRLGKGEGYSDLEWAILAESGRVDPQTPVVTTVHERQVVSDRLPVSPHDVSLNVITTCERTIRPADPASKPVAIDWSLLDDADLEEMPILTELAPTSLDSTETDSDS